MSNGYVQVRVAANDWRYEHRVIWEEAHGPIPDGCHVHHLNHDPSDNRLPNLELVDGRRHVQYHTKQRHALGTLNNRGVRSPRYLDLDDAAIVARVESGESFRSIGRDFGVVHDVISNHYRRAIAGEGRAT